MKKLHFSDFFTFFLLFFLLFCLFPFCLIFYFTIYYSLCIKLYSSHSEVLRLRTLLWWSLSSIMGAYYGDLVSRPIFNVLRTTATAVHIIKCIESCCLLSILGLYINQNLAMPVPMLKERLEAPIHHLLQCNMRRHHPFRTKLTYQRG